MKRMNFFKNEALLFAKKEDDGINYDAIKFLGFYEDYEVYQPYCKCWKNNPPVIGRPQLVLINEKGARWEFKDPFKIMDDCYKPPAVVFKYESTGYLFNNSTSIILYADGSLIKYVSNYQNLLDSEYEIQKKPELVTTIRQLAINYKEQLNKIPRSLFNPLIFDGASHKIQIGRMKFEGPNILTMKINEEDNNQDNQLFRFGDECFKYLAQFQKVFEHFRKAINESIGEEVI